MKQFTYDFDPETRRLTVNDTAALEVLAGKEDLFIRWIKRAGTRLLNSFLSEKEIRLNDRTITIVLPAKADATDIAAFAGAVSMSLAHVASICRHLNADRIKVDDHPLMQLEMASMGPDLP